MSEIRVLIVDDCVELASLMSQYLGEQKGISVVGEASNGIEALEILTRKEVDIILLDIIMRQMDGFSLLQEMRKTPLKHTPKVIVVSALARDDYVKRAFDLGVSYYIVKPFDIKALLNQIIEVANTPLLYIEPQHLAYPLITNILDERISTLLLSIGIPLQSLGFRYLKEAIIIVNADHDIINRITKEVYPVVGKHFGTTASRVERSMRHAIEVAWNRGEKELSDIFGYKATSREDKPTNGQFIATILEKGFSMK